MLRKGYTTPDYSLLQQVIQKHSDLPSFWRERYCTKMKEVASLKSELIEYSIQSSNLGPSAGGFNIEKERPEQLSISSFHTGINQSEVDGIENPV